MSHKHCDENGMYLDDDTEIKTVISDAALESMKKDKRFIAACHAMQGMMSHSMFNRGEAKCDIAVRAVGYADALLKELDT